MTECFELEQVEDDRLVTEWACAESVGAMLTHRGADRFSDLMRLQPQTAHGTIRGFRGRLREQIGGEPSPFDFGPPPADITTLFRYNEDRCPVLYLASTPEGVWAEVNHHRGSRTLSCQEFFVDVSTMRILDASWRELHNFLHLAWDMAERPELPEYKFSRTLAKLVRAAGFQGMLVPGVQGKLESRYSNLVMFDPESRWHDWLAPGRNPFNMHVAPS